MSYASLLTPHPSRRRRRIPKQKKPIHTDKLLIGLLLNHLQHLSCQHNILNIHYCEYVAVWTRLELATPCVTGRYSNQLNYQTNVPICFHRNSQQ